MAQSIKLLIQTSVNAKNWSIARVAGVCSCSQYLVGQSATFGPRATEQALERRRFLSSAGKQRGLISRGQSVALRKRLRREVHGLSKF
jgi:hypothetical protein